LLDDELSSAISSLPEDFRTVIILCDIERYTYEEIADFVDIPVGTVRSRLHRARKCCLQNYIKYADDKGYVNKSKDKR
jgi:RNA polymerase sigma-70 factor (ECF subfamily)